MIEIETCYRWNEIETKNFISNGTNVSDRDEWLIEMKTCYWLQIEMRDDRNKRW